MLDDCVQYNKCIIPHHRRPDCIQCAIGCGAKTRWALLQALEMNVSPTRIQSVQPKEYTRNLQWRRQDILGGGNAPATPHKG